MINGIIFSLLWTYMRQNTRETDYQSVALKLFHRYADRGWKRVLLKDIIFKANKEKKRQQLSCHALMSKHKESEKSKK